MKLPSYEMARLRKIEQWADEQTAAHVVMRPWARKLVGLVNLAAGTNLDVDDAMVPVSNVRWLLNIIKRELERDR